MNVPTALFVLGDLSRVPDVAMSPEARSRRHLQNASQRRGVESECQRNPSRIPRQCRGNNAESKRCAF